MAVLYLGVVARQGEVFLHSSGRTECTHARIINRCRLLPSSVRHFRSRLPTMSTTPTPGQRISFQAELENWAEGLDYCAVAVPAGVTESLGTRGPVLVLAQLEDSEPFQVSLFPVGGGQHYIRIKAKVRQETNSKVGDRVRIRITVLDRADVSLPDDLARALASEGLVESFKALAPGKQNYAIRRIDDAVKPITRDKRIQEAVLAAHERREQTKDRRPSSRLARSTRSRKGAA